MNRKGFRKMADIVVDLNIKYPHVSGVVQRTKNKILEVLREEPKFVEHKWEDYVTRQIEYKTQGR